jgi:hypothetical protein
MSEWMQSMGHEEGHHSVYFNVKQKGNEVVDANSVTLAEYHAQSMEFRALRYVIQRAETLEFSTCAIAFLTALYQESSQLRQQQVPEKVVE